MCINFIRFGIFECPLPEFDPTAKYCCGSYEEKTQFCCDYYDKYGFDEPDNRFWLKTVIF